MNTCTTCYHEPVCTRDFIEGCGAYLSLADGPVSIVDNMTRANVPPTSPAPAPVLAPQEPTTAAGVPPSAPAAGPISHDCKHCTHWTRGCPGLLIGYCDALDMPTVERGGSCSRHFKPRQNVRG